MKPSPRQKGDLVRNWESNHSMCPDDEVFEMIVDPGTDPNDLQEHWVRMCVDQSRGMEPHCWQWYQ